MTTLIIIGAAIALVPLFLFVGLAFISAKVNSFGDPG